MSEQHDAAFEAVRKAFCALPRYSFHLSNGGVRRVPDRSGNWVEFGQAHQLFDPVAVDAAIAKAEAMPVLLSALNAMMTQFGMDEDEWSKPTFDQARDAIRKASGA